MKKYLKSILYTTSLILISAIIITILNYFNVLNGNLLKILEILTLVIAIFIGSYKLGKLSSNKGYLEGLKYGIIWIIILIIINLITKTLTIFSILYLIILLFISILGSILGINKKQK